MDLGFFKATKMGKLLGLGNEVKKVEDLQMRSSVGRHLEDVVAFKSYQLTIGNFLRNGVEKDYGRLRSRNREKDLSLERLNGRLEVWDEINDFIQTTITVGQKAAEKLNEEQNARTKRAG